MNPPLRLHDVSFTYRGAASPTLQHLDLELTAGSFVAITGRTGAGKTTCVRLFNGLIPFMLRGELTGEVALFGEPLTADRRHEAVRRVGMVFQDFEAQLFSTDLRAEVAFALENQGVPPGEMTDRVDRSLQTVGLSHLIDREPSTLSGGEKQRLAIACLLAAEPEVMVFDEPTTDLDPVGKREVIAILRALADRGHTVVLITHAPELLALTDRVIELHEGAVRHDAPFAAWRADIDRCIAAGVRPVDLALVADAMEWSDVPADVDEAYAQFTYTGWRPYKPPPNHGPVLFELSDVSFGYTPDAPILSNINLQIRRGETVAVLGPNGAGKTTLVGLLNGLRRPTAGRVLFDGRDALSMTVGELGARVGFVYQNPDHQISGATVYDEVVFGLKARGVSPDLWPARVATVLEQVKLSGRENVDPFVMTKGERQKLALAGVLATEPEVIIMDEPSTGLDAIAQTGIGSLLQRLAEAGHTLIVITHEMESALDLAERTIILDGGRIVADGPTNTLFTDAALLTRTHLALPPGSELAVRLGMDAVSAKELTRRLRMANR
jgi:energy-coupling factor transport system ATP-binding protein